MSSSPEPSSGKKAQPVPWTHDETVHLIGAYQQKWYSLNRGQLKSPQWEEVAVTVAARCGYDFSHPSKSALQCRHKMEKLRQRFHRLRHLHALPHSSPSWPYFELMESLLRGPLPLSALPLHDPDGDHHRNSDIDDQVNDDEDSDNGGDEDENCYTKSRSINHILRKPTIVNRFAVAREKSGIGRKCADDGVSRDFWKGEPPAVKRPRNGGGCDVSLEREKGSKEAVLGLAKEIRAFSERIVGMESMKMEMMKETEKWRIEMESKRIEMILRSQHKIVDSIAKAFEPNVAKEEI